MDGFLEKLFGTISGQKSITFMEGFSIIFLKGTLKEFKDAFLEEMDFFDYSSEKFLAKSCDEFLKDTFLRNIR